MNHLISYAMALAAGLIWGVTFSLARIATEAGHHPVGLAWWQALGGGLLLLGYTLLTRTRGATLSPRLRDMIVVGLSGSVIPGTLLFYAAVHVPAGVLAITIAFVPLLTYGISLPLRIDRFSGLRVTGVLSGLVAIMLIMAPDNVAGLTVASSDSLLSDPRFWIAMALLSCLFYTLENIYVDGVVPGGTDVSRLLCGGMLLAAAMLLPVVLISDAFVILSFPFDTAEWAIVVMMFVSAVAYLLYLLLIKRAGAVFASMSGYIVTLAGVFWGIVLFNEQHSVMIWLALLLMLIGMVLVTPRAQTDKPHHNPRNDPLE